MCSRGQEKIKYLDLPKIDGSKKVETFNLFDAEHR